MISFADDPPPHPEPLPPDSPLPLPGTPQREALLHERAMAGQELHQPGDVLFAPDQRANYRRLRNGQDRIDRECGTTVQRPDPEEKPSRIRDRKTATQKTYELAFPWLKALGDRLRSLRGRRSLGQVALVSGVPKQTLARLEAGQTPRPRLDTLLLLADFHRLSLDELVGRRLR